MENPQPAVDGGDGMASVKLGTGEKKVVEQMAKRTKSDPSIDPITGADLGSGKAVGGKKKV